MGSTYACLSPRSSCPTTPRLFRKSDKVISLCWPSINVYRGAAPAHSLETMTRDPMKCSVESSLLVSLHLSLIHISEPTRLGMISYAVFCLKKKKKKRKTAEER